MAIVLVVLAHAKIPGFHQAGAAGVATFFVLSGYLITSILLQRPHLPAFYARRAARLLPAFALLLLILGTLAVSIDAVGVGRSMLLAMLYVSNWARIFGIMQGVLGHTWSLSVEEQFYLVWPAVIFFTPRRYLSRTMLVIILFSLILRFAVSSTHAYEGTDTNAYAFALGGLCAKHSGLIRLPSQCAWLGLGLLLAAALWSSGAQEHAAFVASIGAALVIWHASTSNAMAPRLLSHLGTVSYGWYLWHFPMVRLVGLGPHFPGAELLAALAALGIAEVSYRFLEAPISNWARRRWPYHGKRPAMATQGQVAIKDGLVPAARRTPAASNELSA